MPYSNLTQTENDLYFKDGVEFGLTLVAYQNSFLENTIIENILTNQKTQKRFEELFKFGYYFTPMANDYPYRQYDDWTKIASHFYCEIFINKNIIN